MKELERALGALEEFKSWSKSEFLALHEHIEALREDVDKINKARWIFFGQSGVLYSIVVMIIEFILHKTLFVGG